MYGLDANCVLYGYSCNGGCCIASHGTDGLYISLYACPTTGIASGNSQHSMVLLFHCYKDYTAPGNGLIQADKTMNSIPFPCAVIIHIRFIGYHLSQAPRLSTPNSIAKIRSILKKENDLLIKKAKGCVNFSLTHPSKLIDSQIDYSAFFAVFFAQAFLAGAFFSFGSNFSSFF